MQYCLYCTSIEPSVLQDEPVNAQHYSEAKKVADQFRCPLISGWNRSGFDGVKAVMVHRLGTQDAATGWFYTFGSRGRHQIRQKLIK